MADDALAFDGDVVRAGRQVAEEDAVAVASGAGAESRVTLGIVICSGVLVSTVLTLVVVPVAYMLLDDLAAWARRRWWPDKLASAAQP